jgi:osomolarity two-component system sensor histidine kinase SLN1
MPNLDGLQSTRLIRGMGYSAPIVALSAFSEESNIKDCMDSGMDMFIRYVYRIWTRRLY